MNDDTPCDLTKEPGYVVYSSMGSFYIPLAIIIFVYLKIFQVSISSTFYACVFHTKVLFSGYVLAKKALSYKKHARKMLVKLTTSLNSIKSE